MPETFTHILDDIADEGRDRMRPFPASEVHALARRLTARRRRAAASTAGVAALAVSAGLVLTNSGGGGSSVPPGGITSPAVPGTSSPGQASEPVVDGFLKAGQLPHEDLLKWIVESLYTAPPGHLEAYEPMICGRASAPAQAVPTSVVQNQIRTDYTNGLTLFPGNSGPAIYGGETIYTYASADDAAKAYAGWVPVPGHCEASPTDYDVASGTGVRTGTVEGGFAWSQTVTWSQPAGQTSTSRTPSSSSTPQPRKETDHFLVAHNGRTIAVLEYVEQLAPAQRTPTLDSSGDQQALAAMAVLLRGPRPGI